MAEQAHFSIDGKTVTVYPADETGSPVIYLNTYAGDGSEENEILRHSSTGDFTLAVIGGLNWDHDMSPWEIPPIAENDTPCTGGADNYLRLLTDEIIPEAEKRIAGEPLWRGIAGYSLAGLFAVYAAYQTDVFARIGSMSGSLWFPDFKEYVFAHKPKCRLDCIYFSLGNQECKTSNPFLKVVQENTEAIYEFIRNSGIDTVFEMNPGNHFKDGHKRTAAGIAWLLSR